MFFAYPPLSKTLEEYFCPLVVAFFILTEHCCFVNLHFLYRNFRGDCQKPSLRRVPIVRLFFLPYSIFQWCQWSVRWYIDYWILRKPYDDDAKAYLTRRRLGLNADQWDGLEETRRQSYLRMALWIPANFKVNANGIFCLLDCVFCLSVRASWKSALWW